MNVNVVPVNAGVKSITGRVLFAIFFVVCLHAQDIAIVGSTITDRNGGAPIPDGVVLIAGERISAVGPRASIVIPPGATVIQASVYIVPGFIDTNVHLSLYGGARDRYETLAKYHWRENEIVLEGAQIQLRHGVTTVRDIYGMLEPLTLVRDAIARHEAIGARTQAAGNHRRLGRTLLHHLQSHSANRPHCFPGTDERRYRARRRRKSSRSSPAELRVAIGKYLDKGPDFLKFGATSHFSEPSFIGFSPQAQKVLVEETHRRGLSAEVHSTTLEGLRLSLTAGIDLIQLEHHYRRSLGKTPERQGSRPEKAR